MEHPLLTGEDSGRDEHMNCPHCGQYNGLHIDTVELHSAGGQSLTATAHGEDERASIEVELSPRQKTALTGRRHTVVLIATCEMCGARSRISFEQHKGVTLFAIDSEYSPPDENISI